MWWSNLWCSIISLWRSAKGTWTDAKAVNPLFMDSDLQKKKRNKRETSIQSWLDLQYPQAIVELTKNRGNSSTAEIFPFLGHRLVSWSNFRFHFSKLKTVRGKHKYLKWWTRYDILGFFLSRLDKYAFHLLNPRLKGSYLWWNVRCRWSTD